MESTGQVADVSEQVTTEQVERTYFVIMLVGVEGVRRSVCDFLEFSRNCREGGEAAFFGGAVLPLGSCTASKFSFCAAGNPRRKGEGLSSPDSDQQTAISRV